MKNDGNKIFIYGMLGVAIYIGIVLCVLAILGGVVDPGVKKFFFDMYGVPYGK